MGDLHGHHHGVDALVGLRRVRALAFDGDVEFIARRHHRPCHHAQRARFGAWPVVHAVDGIHGKLAEQAVCYHFARAGAAFFGRLEDQVHGAVEMAVLRQVMGGTEQHGRVAVVAAGVHLARVA